jgi:hypothetical protein
MEKNNFDKGISTFMGLVLITFIILLILIGGSFLGDETRFYLACVEVLLAALLWGYYSPLEK